MYDITALGEILIDFTMQGVNEDGQALFAQNPGGAPANVLVVAGKLGDQTAFIGKVGNDMHGLFLKEVLKAQQINTDSLVVDDDYFTTLAFVSHTPDGERTFSFARKPGADTQLKKEEVHREILEHTHIFHVGSLSLTAEPSRETTFYAVECAKKAGSIISYDPNYRASLWQDRETAMKHMRSLIPYVDVMKISDEETGLLTDIEDVKEAAKALCAQGVKVAVVTMGKDGAYVCNKDGGQTVPGFVSKAVDTNGAGDSFWGGFLHRLHVSQKRPEELTQEELYDFARFGNAVASLCVEKKGAIPAMPTLQQVQQRLAK